MSTPSQAIERESPLAALTWIFSVMGCQETSRPPAGGFELRYSYTPTVGKNNDEAARRQRQRRERCCVLRTLQNPAAVLP